MKRIILGILACALVMFAPIYAFADSSDTDVTREYLSDGSYYETVIDDAMPIISFKAVQNSSRRTTVTKSKTTYYKNSSGKTMWYVKVTGTFTYGNGSAVCTKAKVTAESKNNAWKVSNKSATKRGNRATAKATGTHYSNGFAIESVTRSVMLVCSPTGQFT